MVSTRLLMLDSGAYTVWTQGASVDLDHYIRFCVDHPDISYYINLDVLPGKPNVRRSVTRESVEESCQQSWVNYRRMLRHLPKKKVIPVFHRNDHVKWLHKYLELDVPYMGISPLTDGSTGVKLRWLSLIKKYLFDRNDHPLVKTHGFAVTSFDVMRAWDWYSVDSSSWKLSAAWGNIYLPHKHRGEYVYDVSPLLVSTSPMSPQLKRGQYHVSNSSPLVKQRILEYLEYLGLILGEYTVVPVRAGYKLSRPREEIWHTKPTQVLRPITKGVMTSFEERLKVNAHFMQEANKVLPVRHIYFAGAPMPYPLEFQLGRRLLSYYDIGRSGKSWCLDHHLELIRQYREEGTVPVA